MFHFDRPKIEVFHAKEQVTKIKLHWFAKMCCSTIIILKLNHLPCAALRATFMRAFQSSCSIVNVDKSPVFNF
jgi:hypothetical protein